MQTVSSLGLKNVVCCTVLTRIDEIQRLMKENNLNEMAIVDNMLEKHLLGVVTQENIQKQAALLGASPSQLSTEQVITRIPAVKESSSWGEVKELFTPLKLNNVPVMDREGRFCGVVDINNSVQ